MCEGSTSMDYSFSTFAITMLMKISVTCFDVTQYDKTQ